MNQLLNGKQNMQRLVLVYETKTKTQPFTIFFPGTPVESDQFYPISCMGLVLALFLTLDSFCPWFNSSQSNY